MLVTMLSDHAPALILSLIKARQDFPSHAPNLDRLRHNIQDQRRLSTHLILHALDLPLLEDALAHFYDVLRDRQASHPSEPAYDQLRDRDQKAMRRLLQARLAIVEQQHPAHARIAAPATAPLAA